jgi:hypothetical protein
VLNSWLTCAIRLLPLSLAHGRMMRIVLADLLYNSLDLMHTFEVSFVSIFFSLILHGHHLIHGIDREKKTSENFEKIST